MECKICGYNLNPGDAFCCKCGAKVELPPEPPKIPRVMTVKEAAEIFFGGKISRGLLYEMVRRHRIPHTRLTSGKVLFDVQELSQWWAAEQQRSKEVRDGLASVKPL